MAGATRPVKKPALKVTVSLVSANIGSQVLQFSYGDILPEGVAEESLEHLKSLGYVEEIDAPESDDK